MRVRCAPRHTAFFGNGDVFKTVRRVSDALGVSVVPRQFCGKGVRGPSNINLQLSHDSDETQEAQWRQLVTEFARQDTALIMHMTNHYCAR